MECFEQDGKKLEIKDICATVESVIKYGFKTWTLTKTLEKWLGGVYTRMLIAVLKTPWKMQITNKELYGDLSTSSNTLKENLDLLAVRREKLMKQHKSCCYGTQCKEKGSQADQDTPMLTS